MGILVLLCSIKRKELAGQVVISEKLKELLLRMLHNENEFYSLDNYYLLWKLKPNTKV